MKHLRLCQRDGSVDTAMTITATERKRFAATGTPPAILTIWQICSPLRLPEATSAKPTPII